MAERSRRRYTREFKKEAIELVTGGEYTIAGAARSLGVGRSLLGRWRQEYLKKQASAFPGMGHQSLEQEELRRLREENRRLRMEKDILKKAAAFFAKESG